MIQIIDTAFTILIWLIIARSLISFIPHDPHKPVFRFIHEVTDPILRPFQRFSIGAGGMGIDFSPMIAIIAIWVIRSVVLNLLMGVLR